MTRADDGGRFFDEAFDASRHPAAAVLHPPFFKSAEAFCAEYVPLSYVVEPIIRTASVYTLTARTGSGKTALAVIIALAVATGRPEIIGMEVTCGRVAYIACENPDDVRMRIKIAAYALDVDLAELGSMFVILDARSSPEQICATMRTMSTAGEFSMVILDTFAAAFDGKDVNDNVQAGEFVRRLWPLTQLPGLPSLLIPAHPTKNAAEDALVPYGGGAILNEVDGNLSLAKRADTGNTVLHWQGKFRGLEFQPAAFRFDILGSPDLLDGKGRQVQLPVLRPCSTEDVEDREAAEVNLDIDILRCLVDEPTPAIREIAQAVGCKKTNVAQKLARLGREKLVEKILGKWKLTAKGKAALNA